MTSPVLLPEPRLILLEGLDLAGKTTLRRELENSLGGGWEVRHNSLLPAGGNPLYDQADRMRLSGLGSPEEVGDAYLRTLEADLATYAPPRSPVIQDSTILLRSVAYHTALGNRHLAQRFEALAPRHPRFDLAWVCTASREVRLRRLAGRSGRGNAAAEDFLVRDHPEVFTHMEDTLLSRAKEWFGAVPLDTSFLEDPTQRSLLVQSIVQLLSPPQSLP